VTTPYTDFIRRLAEGDLAPNGEGKSFREDSFHSWEPHLLTLQESSMLRRGVLALVLLLCFQTSNLVQASFLGTELSVQVEYKQFSTSPPIAIGFLTSALVVDPGVEFPDLSKTQQSNSIGGNIVPVSINAGADYLEFQILPSAGFGGFTPGFFNGYEFTFDSAALPTITELHIDTAVTTLGITSSDVSFSGNHLFLNVAGRSFNSTSFARLDVTVQGGPTAAPEPASFLLMSLGLAGMAGYGRWQRKT
jgi:hypothetical protein